MIAVNPADLKNDRSRNQWRRRGKGVSRTHTRLLVTFYIGVAAILAWLAYGDVAWEAIASSFARLGGLASQAAPLGQRIVSASSPDQQLLNEMSLNLDAVWQRVDRLTAGQEQMAHNVARLAAGQEQLTREIATLHSIEQYLLYKNSDPALQRATPGPAPRRSTQLAR